MIRKTLMEVLRMADLEELIDALSEPGFYPHEPDQVEIRQTDSSVVFLAGDRVYKLKKPLNTQRQNYSTPARRRRMCNLEVELNSRLSPDLYQGVHRVTRRRDGYVLNGRGKVLDYLIEMRRLDDNRRLDHLIEKGKVGEEEMRLVAHHLVEFHRNAERRQLINSFSRPHIIARQWNRRLRESSEFVGSICSPESYTEIVTFASNFLTENRGVIQSRIDKGYICDGHGALHTGHIYLQDGVQVIDCVEYNDRRRYGDIAHDIAGLGLSLDKHGAPDLTKILVAEYEAISGLELSPLLDFYLCYRAHDRALRLSKLANRPEIALEAHQRLAREAQTYYHLADRYARGVRQPVLIVLSGVMGVGKSRLAEALSKVLSIQCLQATESPKTFRDSAKSEKANDEGAKVYDDLLKQAAERLEQGRSIILNATFHT
ncbi:MAG: AAA family ATPase, partial [Chloroflexota bacterium]